MLPNLAARIREPRFQRKLRLKYGFEFRVSRFKSRVSLKTRNSKLETQNLTSDL